MGGGLLQIVAVGQIDEILTINPDFSYFKYSYKKHSNFAIESIKLTFDINPVLSSKISSTYQCKISRYGDLLSNIYFCYTLPPIYSSDKYKFRWIKNVGTLFVKNANINIDGIIIDQLTGEWLNIWNELTMSKDDNKIDSLIGNVDALQEPKLQTKRISIVNNKFIYNYYPHSSKDDIKSVPSINEHKIIVPLNFWFTRNPSLALPLLNINKNFLYINLEVENSERLYQVFSEDLNMYISPQYYNELYNTNITIDTFTKKYDIYPYIEANYVYLSNEERQTIMNNTSIKYLVEQINISTESSDTNIGLNLHLPTKEIIWTTKRNDLYKFNDYSNYTASIPENVNNGILDKASFLWNNNNRIEEKDSYYFNLIQPYQHHSNIPKQGIYCYSFALFPEKDFLSGYYNAALISSKLIVTFKNNSDNSYINNKLTAFGKNPYNINYLTTVYGICYNVFEVNSGMCGMKFA
jgi:hypothetical protein